MRSLVLGLALLMPALGASSCSGDGCLAGDLRENPYCGSNCQRLRELSQGCIGSHTEQTCFSYGTPYLFYIEVGGNDGVRPFYNAHGKMVAIQILGDGTNVGDRKRSACNDAWYGMNLSECTPTSEVRRVLCEGQSY
jgi:hypothetical protein